MREECLAMFKHAVMRTVERVVLHGADIDVEPVRQPTGAPLAWTLQTPCAHAQMQSVHLAVQKRQTVFGKQKHLPLSACVLVEHADRLLPRLMLRIAQFAKIHHMAVNRARAVHAARLHDRPRTVLFPILLADAALQKHAASIE